MEDGERFVAVLEHLFAGVFDAAAFVDHGDDFVDAVLISIMIFHNIDNFAAVFGCSVLEGVDEGEGHFLFADIDAGGLTDIGGTIIKEVVFDLECHAYFFAEEAHLFGCFVAGGGRPCACGAGGGEEGGCFPADDLEVDIFFNIEFACFLDLEEFAFRHFLYGLREDLEAAEFFIGNGEEETFGEEVIANEYGYFVLPQSVDGEEATAFQGIVDHIVMNEGGGMQQLYQGGGAVSVFSDAVAEQPCGEEHEHWPDLFALSLYDIVHDPVQQRNMAFYSFGKLSFKIV